MVIWGLNECLQSRTISRILMFSDNETEVPATFIMVIGGSDLHTGWYQVKYHQFYLDWRPSHYDRTRYLTIWLQSFLYPSVAQSLILYKPSSGTEFCFNVYCFARFFSLSFMFPRLRIVVPPPSTVQGKGIYTIFEVENQEIQFPLLFIKPCKDKHNFFSFKGW